MATKDIIIFISLARHPIYIYRIYHLHIIIVTTIVVNVVSDVIVLVHLLEGIFAPSHH